MSQWERPNCKDEEVRNGYPFHPEELTHELNRMDKKDSNAAAWADPTKRECYGERSLPVIVSICRERALFRSLSDDETDANCRPARHNAIHYPSSKAMALLRMPLFANRMPGRCMHAPPYLSFPGTQPRRQ